MSFCPFSPIGKFQSPPSPSSLVSSVVSILPDHPLPKTTPTVTLLAVRNYLAAAQLGGLFFDKLSDASFNISRISEKSRTSKSNERRIKVSAAKSAVITASVGRRGVDSISNGERASALSSQTGGKSVANLKRSHSVAPTKTNKDPVRSPPFKELPIRTKTPERSPTALYRELDVDSRHILRGRFLPKGAVSHLPSSKNVAAQHKQLVALISKKRICLSGCRYEVFTKVAVACGFEVVPDNDLWNIHWSDSPLGQDKIMQMRRVQDMYSVFWGLHAPLQKCNHFPGMYEICRKDRLGRNLNRLRRLYPCEYNFFPETFDLPTEQSDLTAYARRRRKNNLTFIIKPESGCQGKGIFLLRNLKKLSPFAKCVCQVYVPHPFLIDGYKFDQRVYVLITCVDPLRLYIYDEGIARFATVKYEVPNEENLEVVYMHLTNYSLNKFSESYVREGEGSKRLVSSIYAWMQQNGYDVAKLVRAIDDIVVKTLLCAGPTLKHNYKTSFPKRDRGCSCFELLGFDILIDRHLNPILLEVNHSCSLNVDLPVDHQVKKALIRDMLNMVYLGDELLQPQSQGTATVGKKNKKGRISKKANGSKSLPAPPPPPPRIPSRPPSAAGSVAEERSSDGVSGISEALQRQFKHEIRNRGRFRLVYTSDKPGRFSNLHSKESYCGYHAGTAGPAPPQQLIPYDKEPDTLHQHQELWRPTKTTSSLKETKRGVKYVETRVILQQDMIGTSTRDVQRFREIPTSNHRKREERPHPQGQQLLGVEKSKSKLHHKSLPEGDARLQLLQQGDGCDKTRRKSGKTVDSSATKGERERPTEKTPAVVVESGDYERNSREINNNYVYDDFNNTPRRINFNYFNNKSSPHR